MAFWSLQARHSHDHGPLPRATSVYVAVGIWRAILEWQDRHDHGGPARVHRVRAAGAGVPAGAIARGVPL